MFALRWAGLTLAPTCMNLLNLTSRRDASHPCLISTWLKKGCTVVCVINLCRWEQGSTLPIPKRTILDWGKICSSHKKAHTTVHHSLVQVLIRQGWEASLPDVGLSKFVWVDVRADPIYPKANNTWLGKDLFLPQKGALRAMPIKGIVCFGWRPHRFFTLKGTPLP